jgi:hypothetical protein
VFAKNYHLPSLVEIHEFINNNHHLPGIPSAAEVQTNGLDVGKNQTALMQKVEELTLYMIKHDEEMKALKKKIYLQGQQILMQQKQIKHLRKSIRFGK